MLGLSSHTHSSILLFMTQKEVLAVDLGQFGTSFRLGGKEIQSARGKLAGESTLEALRAVFSSIESLKADCVALSCMYPILKNT